MSGGMKEGQALFSLLSGRIVIGLFQGRASVFSYFSQFLATAQLQCTLMRGIGAMIGRWQVLRLVKAPESPILGNCPDVYTYS